VVVELRLEGVLMDRPDELLELLVGGQDQRCRGHLVEVAHLESHDPVLDVVDDPDAVPRADLAGALEQVDELEPLAVQRHRHAPLEGDDDVLVLVGRLLGPGHELEDVVARRLLDVLDRPAF
jgi:hypothetical protein